MGCQYEQWMEPTVRMSGEWDRLWGWVTNGTDCEDEWRMGPTVRMSDKWDRLWGWVTNGTDCEDEWRMGLTVRMSDEWDWLWGWVTNGTVCEDEWRMGLTVRMSSEHNWLFRLLIIVNLIIIGAKTSCLAATVLVMDQERHKMNILFSSLQNILLAKRFTTFPVGKCNIWYDHYHLFSIPEIHQGGYRTCH